VRIVASSSEDGGLRQASNGNCLHKMKTGCGKERYSIAYCCIRTTASQLVPYLEILAV
jgi:hypothetical protein